MAGGARGPRGSARRRCLGADGAAAFARLSEEDASRFSGACGAESLLEGNAA